MGEVRVTAILEQLKRRSLLGLKLFRRKGTAAYIDSIIESGPDSREGPSIAVLPFADRSEKGNQAYFGEGFAEDVINTLCTGTNLRVVPRTSAFQLDAKSLDVRDAGEKLNVQTLLKGSVRKVSGQIEIEAQLLDVGEDSQSWSNQFAGNLEDVFKIQEQIAVLVSDSVGGKLRAAYRSEMQNLDPKAYDLFLRALNYFARHTVQDNVYARQMLKQAIEIEPNYGRAWAGIAYTHGYEYMYFNASDVNLEEARSTSAKALKLAPGLAQSHVSAGIAHCMGQDYKHAGLEFEKAIRLEARNYHAWYFFARAKVQEGDLESALKLFDRASRVRPEDFQSVLLQAQLYTSLNQKGRALEVTREGIKRVKIALRLNPRDNRALNMGAFALLRMGQMEEASKWMLDSMHNAPMDSIIQYNGACFFSLAGQTERALDCLENCLIKVGNISREWLVHDSDMDNIRTHPRYQEIIKTFPE